MASSSYQNYNLPNDFDGLNSNISSNIYKIRQNVNQITQLAKLVGTAKDNDGLRTNIHKIFQNTNETAQQTSASLKKMSNMRTNSSELAFSKSKRAFESEIESYSKIQKEVSDKLRKTAPVQDYSTSRGANEDSNDESSEQTQLLKQKTLQDLDNRYEFIKDRETKIKQIETDILDINSIMRDLAGMVNEQSSLVDNITSNVENTHSNVELGNVQLQQASKYAFKSRKKLMILILILVCVMVALGLILYFTLKK